MMQTSSQLESLYATFASLRQARVGYVAANRHLVAEFIDQAAASRAKASKQAAARHVEMRRSLAQFRQSTRREVGRTLAHYRSDRQRRSQQTQRALSACTRDVRWQVGRILRSSAANRMRNERERIRTTGQALSQIRRRVESIRRAVNASRPKPAASRMRFGS